MNRDRPGNARKLHEEAKRLKDKRAPVHEPSAPEQEAMGVRPVFDDYALAVRRPS